MKYLKATRKNEQKLRKYLITGESFDDACMPFSLVSLPSQYRVNKESSSLLLTWPPCPNDYCTPGTEQQYLKERHPVNKTFGKQAPLITEVFAKEIFTLRKDTCVERRPW
jgi:hypothetical protein